VGRASNRKKAQRQAGQKPQADVATQQALLTLATGLQAMVDENEKRDEGVAAASRAWCGGAEPVPAQAPRWPEDSLGHRFFAGTHLSRARTAPCLVTAEIPAATVITADSAHWSVAASPPAWPARLRSSSATPSPGSTTAISRSSAESRPATATDDPRRRAP
jgi:hypothetical protein